MKLDVTKKAVEVIKDILKDKEDVVNNVRIHVAGVGWGGPTLGLVLDEQKDNDEVFDIEGLTFLVEKDLAQFEGFEVDYSEAFLRKGFVINPMYNMGGNC